MGQPWSGGVWSAILSKGLLSRGRWRAAPIALAVSAALLIAGCGAPSSALTKHQTVSTAHKGTSTSSSPGQKFLHAWGALGPSSIPSAEVLQLGENTCRALREGWGESVQAAIPTPNTGIPGADLYVALQSVATEHLCPSEAPAFNAPPTNGTIADMNGLTNPVPLALDEILFGNVGGGLEGAAPSQAGQTGVSGSAVSGTSAVGGSGGAGPSGSTCPTGRRLLAAELALYGPTMQQLIGTMPNVPDASAYGSNPDEYVIAGSACSEGHAILLFWNNRVGSPVKPLYAVLVLQSGYWTPHDFGSSGSCNATLTGATWFPKVLAELSAEAGSTALVAAWTKCLQPGTAATEPCSTALEHLYLDRSGGTAPWLGSKLELTFGAETGDVPTGVSIYTNTSSAPYQSIDYRIAGCTVGEHISWRLMLQRNISNSSDSTLYGPTATLVSTQASSASPGVQGWVYRTSEGAHVIFSQ